MISLLSTPFEAIFDRNYLCKGFRGRLRCMTRTPNRLTAARAISTNTGLNPFLSSWSRTRPMRLSLRCSGFTPGRRWYLFLVEFLPASKAARKC